MQEAMEQFPDLSSLDRAAPNVIVGRGENTGEEFLLVQRCPGVEVA